MLKVVKDERTTADEFVLRELRESRGQAVRPRALTGNAPEGVSKDAVRMAILRLVGAGQARLNPNHSVTLVEAQGR